MSFFDSKVANELGRTNSNIDFARDLSSDINGSKKHKEQTFNGILYFLSFVYGVCIEIFICVLMTNSYKSVLALSV